MFYCTSPNSSSADGTPTRTDSPCRVSRSIPVTQGLRTACEPHSLATQLPLPVLINGSFVQPDYEHVADTCCDWGRDAKFSTYPPPSANGNADIYKPEVLVTIEAELDKLDAALHRLSMSIHGTCDHRHRTRVSCSTRIQTTPSSHSKRRALPFSPVQTWHWTYMEDDTQTHVRSTYELHVREWVQDH